MPPQPQVAFPAVEVTDSKPVEEVSKEQSPNSNVRLPVRQTQQRVLASPKRRQNKNPFDRTGDRDSKPERTPKKVNARALRESQPPPPIAAAPAKKRKRKPAKKKIKKLSLGESPDYPTSKIERIANPNSTAAQRSGMTLAKANEQAAEPTHHPPITILERTDYRWIDCCFELEKDGSFEVYLLTQIHDPIHKAIALRTLNRWKWKPKTVRGVPVASQEFLRLRSRTSRR